MKKVKFSFYIIVGITIHACLYSCMDDESINLKSFLSIATVQVTNNDTYSFLLDNGEDLKVVESLIPGYKAVENQRVFIEYQYLSEDTEEEKKTIRLIGIQNIVTKNTINLTQVNADSIGNDPLQVLEMWSGGDFLNIYYMFHYGNTKPHMLNLVDNTMADHDDYPDGKIHLELRHNAFDDPYTTQASGYICFNLKPFRRENSNSQDFVIRVNNYDGAKDHNITCKYLDLQIPH